MPTSHLAAVALPASAGTAMKPSSFSPVRTDLVSPMRVAPAIYNLQGLTLNSGATFTGSVVAPGGTVVVNGALHGRVIADRLIVNSRGVVQARD
jgi:hypothetical protein